jgi:hypothetical protein
VQEEVEKSGAATQTVIGVTGHRKLGDRPAITRAVRSAIDSIRQMAVPLPGVTRLLIILSPLAEGADRLVVREALRVPGTVLKAVLPMVKDDYMQDFTTEESKKEFEELLAQARSISILPVTSSRVEAYGQVGRYVVDQCDILVAIWDGNPSKSRGGTQEIVRYARDINRPLVWIHAENPSRIVIERGDGLNIGAIH